MTALSADQLDELRKNLRFKMHESYAKEVEWRPTDREAAAEWRGRAVGLQDALVALYDLTNHGKGDAA